MEQLLINILGIIILLFLVDKLSPFSLKMNPFGSNKFWTYIEDESVGYLKVALQKMRYELPDLIILSPQTVHKYLPEFPLTMGDCNDPECLKDKIDILFAYILEKYGGTCISPGCLVMPSIYKFMNKTYSRDIVTINNTDNTSVQNYIVGGKKNSEISRRYKESLLKRNSIINITPLEDNKSSSDILYELIIELKPCHYNFPAEYGGFLNMDGDEIIYGQYFEKMPIKNINSESIITLIIPFNELLKNNKLGEVIQKDYLELQEDNINIVEYIRAPKKKLSRKSIFHRLGLIDI